MHEPLEVSLLKALAAGDVQSVRTALDAAPALVEQRDAQGVPLSHYGARSGDLALVRYLVEYSRMSLNTVDAQNRDFLYYAAESGNVPSCRYLVERCGMNPLRADLSLITPFDVAHTKGHTALCAYFETVVGAPRSGLYQNPIRRGMFPDPSIVRVGEDYYMVNSSFIFFPCIPISHSRDLVHWHVIGYAITRPEWAQLDGLEGGRGYWAPDISYCDGLFYICATYRLNDDGPPYRRQMVVTSTRPEGPYSQPVFFDEDGIDPSIFHDDDGRHYMLINRGARIFEIDASATRPLGEATLLYYGDHKRAPEGPHLLKKDGYYYLFLAEGGTGPGHRETVARARTLHGPYEPCPYNPILRQTDEGALIQRCGHAKPVCTQHGDWYMVYLCGRALDGRYTLLGRETALDAITWTADGWPIVNGGKGPSTLARLPRGLTSDAPCKDGDTYWTPRAPMPGTITPLPDGVYIAGSPYPLTDVRCRSLYLRRQAAFTCTYSATLTVPEFADDGEAGIACYYDEHSFLTFSLARRAGMQVLLLREQRGLEGEERTLCPCALAPGARLRLRVQVDGLTRTLGFTSDDRPYAEVVTLQNVTYLADEGVRLGKRFTGAMLGVFALGNINARFADLHYEES